MASMVLAGATPLAVGQAAGEIVNKYSLLGVSVPWEERKSA